ncbi:hypothetical protein PHLCEN_2v5429 [Hermanssonia centrifuga]|uniref:Phospho-2-dehydro-3-deoxyheptonate aldolase n=1 Tax=Hermanssonia centrifuga TaxID=98765 RepID=A0A2R6P2I7_9APHY|nr:hypothetical protein PHLCEN_2v5429 [Hermanssonia centrifuga]
MKLQVRIGRIAGQYAKPRSSAMEKIGDREVLSFRKEFERISDGLSDALGFTRTIGVGMENAPYEKGGGRGVLGEVDFYTSHEGLMLNYEEAMTREFPLPPGVAQSHSKPLDTEARPKAFYNTSAHFLWIGDRTRQLDGAHVEYFRGIRNPIGIKVGPSMVDDELVRLLDKKYLPGHIAAVQKSGHPVIWICDPMHGNTLTSSSGLKTRHFGTIISELTACIRVHAASKSRLGGVSLEFTGELAEDGFSVTECLGGSMGLSEEQLGLRYQVRSPAIHANHTNVTCVNGVQSFCDPRLNFEQSLDVAFLISNHFKKERLGEYHENVDVLYAELGGQGPA